MKLGRVVEWESLLQQLVQVAMPVRQDGWGDLESHLQALVKEELGKVLSLRSG